MNFLKKKLKPLTSGFNQSATSASGNQRAGHNKDLEEDLYDEIVVEAPPHPSELLALGVEPSEIDINDPDKLRELYRKARAEGKDKKYNSVLLARQRQKEEIEEKKRTREEWKFFDSLTSRVEQVVKESQKNIDHWKESSAVDELAEPEYELRQTADEVFRSVTAAKLEKGASDWIDFDEESSERRRKAEAESKSSNKEPDNKDQQFDEFGCPRRRASSSVNETQSIVVKEILEDFGIDLRTAEQRKALEKKQAEGRRRAANATSSSEPAASKSETSQIVPRPRPRPKGATKEEAAAEVSKAEESLDPFDTSFVASASPEAPSAGDTPGGSILDAAAEEPKQSGFVDPFDTSYVNL